MKRKWVLWLPLMLMLGIMVGFYAGLENPTDHIIESQVVGQELPDFAAPAAFASQPGTNAADFRSGKPRLLNIFASWCVPCVQEIPVLNRLKAQGVEIGGIAIHDSPAALDQFLASNGNPYSSIGMDADGKVQIAIGSSGVPETFVIDGNGRIILQHIGVVSEADVPALMAKLERAR